MKKRELDYYKFSQKQGVIIDRLKADKRELVEALEKINKIKINHNRYDEYVDAVRDIVINCLHKEAL